MFSSTQDSLVEDSVRESQSIDSQDRGSTKETKAKRTLIIPDVHHKWKKAQEIIDSIPHDHVIHLGDHQDNFGDNVYQAITTAKWTRDRLDAGDTILLGNHDLPYWFWHDKHNWGCGWEPEKHVAIQGIIPAEKRKLFKLWVECEGWVLSHAGFSNIYANLIPHHDIFMEETLWAGSTHPLIYHVGQSRGGRGISGGVLWLDWNDMRPLDNIRQLVGHTPHKKPQHHECRRDDNFDELDWNLDTHLHHYGIIEGGVLSIYEVPTLVKG